MSATTRIALKALAISASSLALMHTAPAMAQVEEIIVTSQKVEENVQDVPIAITAVSGDRLTQAVVFSLENISTVVPSVTFRKGTTSANSAIVMRGVGTITFSVAAEPSVSTVVDGVVLSRSGQAFMDLVDLERLEVLRGPQGTLFGRNASAGLVNIVSKGGTDEFEAEANADLFEGGEYRLRAAISGPLGENLSARLTGFYGTFDGNITNINGGQNNTVNGYERHGVRGIMDYDDGGNKVRLIADFYKANDDCCADVTGASRGAAQDALLGLPGGVALGENQRFINHDLVTSTQDEQWSLTATGDFDITDTHTLSVVLGYRNWENTENREGDFLPRAITTAGQLHDFGTVKTEQLSAEIRLASDQSKPFFYQVGAFAWQSDNSQDFTRRGVTCATSTLAALPGGAIPCNRTDTVNTLLPFATSRSDVRSQNYALFGQATYQITEQLSLTGGLRYTWDDLAFTHTRAPAQNATNGAPVAGPGTNLNPAGGTIASGGNGTNTSRGETTNGNLSGRAAIQFKPSEDVMLYGSYTRGYKGPAFNVFFNHTAPNNAVPISEELSDSFEIGVKSQFLDNRVQLNVAAFSVEYDGFQANNFIVVNTATVSNLTNAGTVKSEGFEADLVVNPIDGLNLRASAAYADARVKEFNPNPTTNAPDARNGTVLPLAPELVYTLGGDYTKELGGVTLYLNTDYRHTSTQFSDLGQSAATRIDPFGIWNASIGFSDPDDKYRVTFHARNITDDSYVLLNLEAGRRLQIPRDADRYFGISLRARM
jgi:iron complex outermembrane receptor protein